MVDLHQGATSFFEIEMVYELFSSALLERTSKEWPLGWANFAHDAFQEYLQLGDQAGRFH